MDHLVKHPEIITLALASLVLGFTAIVLVIDYHRKLMRRIVRWQVFKILQASLMQTIR